MREVGLHLVEIRGSTDSLAITEWMLASTGDDSRRNES